MLILLIDSLLILQHFLDILMNSNTGRIDLIQVLQHSPIILVIEW